jgi:hypothetical protein
MMLRSLVSLILILSAVPVSRALAQSEDERREGFYRHQKNQKARDEEREAGLRDYLKDQADWEEQRQHDKQDDKKRKKTESPVEGGPEYKADRKAKLEDYDDYVKLRSEYMKEKNSHKAKSAQEQAKRDAWEREEYGLDQVRPRFDIAKRNFTDGKGSTGSTGSGGGGAARGSNPNFPPPPAFDDFGGGGNEGYIPPPPPPEIFDAPPPESFPQPVPFPQGGDFDNGNFFPPPPPMPGGFDNGM